MSGCACSGSAAGSPCGCSDPVTAAAECPSCGQTGRKVTALTLASQLKKEARERYGGELDGFNFCNNPSCGNVYYDDAQSVTIGQDMIKSRVTLKNDDPRTPLCYCKKLLKKEFYAMLQRNEPDIAGKIKGIIAGGRSFCEKSNPKGVCCTEDVKTFLQTRGIAWDDATDDTPGSCC